MNELEQPTYFDRPLLKKPHWDWNVITYLFLGGVMGGSGILAALARRSEEAGLERTSRYLSIALAIACPALLISHLGRPERFLHMTRIAKLKSPMSLGVWGLIGYSGFAALNAAAQLSRDRIIPPWIERFEPQPLTGAFQALFGGFMMAYTGVLLSATAIPIWGKGKYHVPAMSVASAISGACALNAIALCADGNGGSAQHKLEKLEACSALFELAVLLHFRSYAGSTGKPMYEGARGERLRTWTIGGGIVAPLLLNLPSILSRKNGKRPSLVRTLAAGALTLTGGYILRETLIEAGKASADDPTQAFVQPK
jgi:formate-dependent nitrite reductase membrane component NrfD